MMGVVRVRVGVSQRLVAVPVCMRNLDQLLRRVLVLVVLVVFVDVRMFESLVGVGVVVNVRGEQKGAARHASQGEKRERMDWFAKHEPGEGRCNAGRQREEGAGMHDPQLAQAPDEEQDRQPVGRGTHDEHAGERGGIPVAELPEQCSQPEIRSAANESLDGDDLPSVPQADALSEVVVESPARARRNNE